MKISVSKDAARWYKNELLLQEGDALCFFVRYGGESTLHKGFSLGIRKDIPVQATAKIEECGVLFYIEEDDEWYFEGRNLSVIYNSKDEEPQFRFE